MNPLPTTLAGLGLIIFAAAPAAATSVTFGQSLGAACYDEAMFGNSSVNALDLCNRALNEEVLTIKDRAATFVNRGIIRANRGDIDGALSDYETALRLKPDLGDAIANIGTAYLRVNRYQEALDQLGRALSYENLAKPSHVYFNIAIAQENLGNTKEAYFNFQKAAELNPDWAWPREELRRFTVSGR
jgi:tetratricopeptide (TPR) repeat protein